jgi:hypothetical protein
MQDIPELLQAGTSFPTLKRHELGEEFRSGQRSALSIAGLSSTIKPQIPPQEHQPSLAYDLWECLKMKSSNAHVQESCLHPRLGQRWGV